MPFALERRSTILATIDIDVAIWPRPFSSVRSGSLEHTGKSRDDRFRRGRSRGHGDRKKAGGTNMLRIGFNVDALSTNFSSHQEVNRVSRPQKKTRAAGSAAVAM